MKSLILLSTIVTLAGVTSAQVAPGQAGQYTGTFAARTVATDSSINDRSKSNVVCSISTDGTTQITADDGLFITGNLVSGDRYGFFSIANEFTTGTGLLKFKARGSLKGRLLYGVRPGGNVAFIVDARLKLKKQDFQTIR